LEEILGWSSHYCISSIGCSGLWGAGNLNKVLPIGDFVEMITEPAVIMIDNKPCPLLDPWTNKQAKQIVLIARGGLENV